MKGITRPDYLRLCTGIGLHVEEDEDDNLIILQPADEDFPYDIVIFVTLNNNMLSYHAGTVSFRPKGNLLERANEFNCTRVCPRAVVRDGAMRMEAHYLLDEEISEDYIVENCIKFPLSSIWRAYLTLYRADTPTD